MAHLYENAKGFKITRHSHSAGEDYSFCDRFYKLKRIDGWTECEKRAAMEFGKAIEAAVEAFYRKGVTPDSAFDAVWAVTKDRTDLTYSDRDKDWERMAAQGRGLMRLFAVIAPTLPIRKPYFQQKLEPEVFPGSELAGIRFQSYLDIIASPESNHPLLPPADVNGKPFRPLIVDVKATSLEYPEDARFLVQDRQLRSYAWASGIRDVALLVFVRQNPEIRRGSKVRVLTDGGVEMVAVETDTDPTTCTEAWWVMPPEAVDALEEYAGALRGKAKETKRLEFVKNAGVLVRGENLTTQRIQFLAARISESKIAEAERVIHRQIVEIVQAAKDDFWPERGGIRFPNAKCLTCPMRGICLGDDKLRDELLVKSGEEWLDEIAAD